MCNQPGMPIAGYQEGGEVEAEDPRFGTVGGRTVELAGDDADIAGITELAYGLMQQGIDLPEQVLAEFTDDQRAAFDLAREGIGSYQPYLDRGAELTERGVELGERGIELGEEGISSLRQSYADTRNLAGQIPGVVDKAIAGLSPDAVRSYMNEYEDAAVQQALSDIARQGQLQEQDISASAVQSGAFGGSREALSQGELKRNVLEQQGRTAAQMRQAGYDAAANRAYQAATATGQLGLSGINTGLSAYNQAGNLGQNVAGTGAGIAGLGSGIAGLGQQYSNFGQYGQQLGLQDFNILSNIGAQNQAQQQGMYDTAYQNQYQRAMQPYQQLAYASDIFTGAPSGQMTSATQPGPSVGSQLVGAGLAGYGMYNATQ